MIHSIKIGKLINARLSQDAELTSKVDNNIFPIVAENGTNYPFVVYTRTGITPKTATKDGRYEDTVNFQVTVVSDSYNESVDVADIVRGLLEMAYIGDESIAATEIYMSGVTERYESEAYIQQMQFTCSVHNTTIPETSNS
jgi:hypothetical protein